MRRLERWAGGLCAAAGMVHVAAGPAHTAEWWAYGLFFYGAAAAQVALAILLFTHGIEGWGGWEANRRRVYVTGLVGTLAIIALWLVTRTIGVPFGPQAGGREPIGALDALSKALEIPLAALLGRLAWLARPAKASVGA